jgi:hypothetical protein
MPQIELWLVHQRTCKIANPSADSRAIVLRTTYIIMDHVLTAKLNGVILY